MIPKKLFIEILKDIKEQDDIDSKVSKSLELISDSWVMINTKNTKYNALSKLLKEVMNDRDDFIGWWLYEDVKKQVTLKDGKKVSIKTPSLLYDFITEHYQKNDFNPEE